MEASKIAKQALKEKKSIREVATEKGVLDPEEAKQIFSKDAILGKRGAIRKQIHPEKSMRKSSAR